MTWSDAYSIASILLSLTREVEQCSIDQISYASPLELPPSPTLSDSSLIEPVPSDDNKTSRHWLMCCCSDDSETAMKSPEESAYQQPITNSLLVNKEKKDKPAVSSKIVIMRQSYPLPVESSSRLSVQSAPEYRIVDPAPSMNSIHDTGLGPFLTSLKSTKRKVVGSNDFM